MSYVVHFCKNNKCNNAWIDSDITNAKTIPPQWKYCKECCNQLGIDFNAQEYKSNLSDEEKQKRKMRIVNYINSKKMNLLC